MTNKVSLLEMNKRKPIAPKRNLLKNWTLPFPLKILAIISVVIIAIFLINFIKQPQGMVKISGGCFTMGAVYGDPLAKATETPAHKVCLKPFYIDRTEVTQTDYLAQTKSNPSVNSKCSDCPVENVSWQEAQNYCNALNKRLPTEAEWEYAAKAGTLSIYPNIDGITSSMGWFKENSNNQTQPVSTSDENPWGLYDMQGNVWEWTQDWADVLFYKNSPVENPKGPINGADRIVRGGAYNSHAYNLRPSARGWASTQERQPYIGFRCVK